MVQVSLGGINLEVADFKTTRRAKLRIYSRVQAFSDSNLIVGVFNTTYQLSVYVPQDFTKSEDVEDTLAAMQGLTETLVDVEGNNIGVTVNQVGSTHLGGQPQLYILDITLTNNNG